MMNDILTRIQKVMGELPDESRRVPLDIEIVEEKMVDGLRYTRISFAVEVMDRCSAWLIRPAGRSRMAAAYLCLHQTTPFAKDEPAGLAGHPHFHYAKELAQRGYVTLAPDYPNFGEYQLNVYARGYASSSMKGIWNHMRAVDFLCAMEEVDSDRVGCIGHSLGGHNTLFLAAFDARIKIAVTSCGFTNWTRNDNEGRGKDGDLTDWTGPQYMPRIARRYGARAENMPFSFEELLSLLAPRPLFINAPIRDFMRYDGVIECLDCLKPHYHACPEKLESCHPDCGHDFPDDVRHRAYAFIDQCLSV